MSDFLFSPKTLRGFTLIEMAVVLVILGLLLGGMLLPISAQMDMEGRRKTASSLEEIKEALIGFAVINGRLPCPASNTSNGLEDSGMCDSYNGYLPAATIGITPVDENGYALDGWGGTSANRIRYAVTTTNGKAFTNGINSFSLTPDLHVCASGTGITNTDLSKKHRLDLVRGFPAIINVRFARKIRDSLPFQ